MRESGSRMPNEDAIALMSAYARLGIKDWRSVNNNTKRRAQELLKNHLAENEPEAMNTIAAMQGAKRPALFIPMPNVHHKGIVQCFFVPLREGADLMSFDLLLLCEGTNCLGFRFEPPQTGTHSYAHIQMNRKMLHGNLEVAGLAGWVPTSYPAFPLCTADPLRMFLSMTTAIHGYRKGIIDVLQTAFTPEPAKFKKYLDLLSIHLGA